MALSRSFADIHDLMRDLVVLAANVPEETITETNFAEDTTAIQTRIHNTSLTTADEGRLMAAPNVVSTRMRAESMVEFQGMEAVDAAITLMLWGASLDAKEWESDNEVVIGTSGVSAANSFEARIALHFMFNIELEVPEAEDEED